MAQIEVEHLVKRYGSITAVDDVSFAVSQGEILGFLGPNGAGKTTTMRIITGYLSPTSGRVRVAGHDVLESPVAARRHLGYLPESAPVYAEMQVNEYLKFIAQMRQIPRGQRKRNIDYVLDTCGLRSYYRHPIAILSKGYRQRVGIAQALLHDPDILILDEHMIGLDPNQIIEVRQIVRSLGQSKTIVFSTHILQEAVAVCSRIIIIHEGRIVADQPLSEVARAVAVGEAVRARIVANPTALREKLSRLEGVQELEVDSRQPAGEGVLCTLTLDPARPRSRDIGETILQLCREEGWRLGELARDPVNLERTFHRLTTRAAAGPLKDVAPAAGPQGRQPGPPSPAATPRTSDQAPTEKKQGD